MIGNTRGAGLWGESRSSVPDIFGLKCLLGNLVEMSNTELGKQA